MHCNCLAIVRSISNGKEHVWIDFELSTEFSYATSRSTQAFDRQQTRVPSVCLVCLPQRSFVHGSKSDGTSSDFSKNAHRYLCQETFDANKNWMIHIQSILNAILHDDSDSRNGSLRQESGRTSTTNEGMVRWSKPTSFSRWKARTIRSTFRVRRSWHERNESRTNGTKHPKRKDSSCRSFVSDPRRGSSFERAIDETPSYPFEESIRS